MSLVLPQLCNTLGWKELYVIGKLRKEIMDLKQQVNKLEEENRILRGIIAKNITPTTKKET